MYDFLFIFNMHAIKLIHEHSLSLSLCARRGFKVKLEKTKQQYALLRYCELNRPRTKL